MKHSHVHTWLIEIYRLPNGTVGDGTVMVVILTHLAHEPNTAHPKFHFYINPNPTISDGTNQNATSTPTCITSLQHVPVNQLSDTCQRYRTKIPLTEIHSGCHHKLILRGRDTAKLRGWLETSYIAGYVARLRGWAESNGSHPACKLPSDCVGEINIAAPHLPSELGRTHSPHDFDVRVLLTRDPDLFSERSLRFIISSVIRTSHHDEKPNLLAAIWKVFTN